MDGKSKNDKSGSHGLYEKTRHFMSLFWHFATFKSSIKYMDFNTLGMSQFS